MLELNTIHLGDSYKLIKNIPDKSIDLIYTDIPYFYKGYNRATHRGGAMWKKKK